MPGDSNAPTIEQPPDVEAGENMHVHKPKAVHGLREFLNEITIIVVGIIIALLLEQAVEAVHRHQEVGEAREALKAEIYQDEQRLRLSVEEGKCAIPQLDAYTAWARGGPKPPLYRSFRPLFRVQTWDTVKSGAVAYMPLKQRIALADFYDLVNTQIRYAANENAADEVIYGFDDLTTLNAEQRITLLKAVAQAKRVQRIVNGAASRVIGVSGDFGTPDQPVALPKVLRLGVDWVCGRTDKDPNLPRS